MDIKKWIGLVGFIVVFMFFNSIVNSAVLDDLEKHKKPIVLGKEKIKKEASQYTPGEVIIKLKEEEETQTLFNQRYSTRKANHENKLSRLKTRYRLGNEKPVFKRLHKQLEIKNFSQNQLRAENRSKFLKQHSMAFEPIKQTDLLPIYTLKTEEDILDICEQLNQDPDIEYAQPNYIYHVQMEPDDFYYHSFGSWGQPYDDLWGIKKIQCEDAWDISQGEGVVVAVIDSGIDYNHPDLWDNIWVNPEVITDVNGDNKINLDDCDLNGNGMIEPNEIVDHMFGWDFVYGDNDPMDGLGHGTHCSGTIAAVGNNEIGVIGVAPQAKIMAVKGLSDIGGGTSEGLAACIRYAGDMGARILSNSWGYSGPHPSDPTLEEAIDYAYDEKSCLVVFAAGNSNRDVSFFSPQNYSKTISVAATTQNDDKCIFSNYGSLVDVSAPGGGYLNELGNGKEDIYNILSTMPDDSTIAGDRPNLKISDGYWRIAGTSMACPHVAGLAALILSENPGLSNPTVRQIIRASCDDIGRGDIGFGRINAYRALSPTILDDGGALQFTSASYAVDETAESITIMVKRMGKIGGAVTVDYTTSDGTAIAGADYTPVSGTLTFGNEELMKSFTIPITNDLDIEEDETIHITLSNPTGEGAILGSPDASVLTIVDNDGGTLQFSSFAHVIREDEGSLAVIVERVEKRGGIITVDYATSDGTAVAGVDYTETSGTLTFGDGERNKIISVPIIDDTEYEEENETFSLELTNPSPGAILGSPTTAIVTIAADRFRDSGIILPRLSNGALSWGDYDNDGDLDLAICGQSGSDYITKIYRNDGDNTFTDINAGLIGVTYSSLAWGDYDNDGYLDLVICGDTGSWTPDITRIYRNNGNDTFTDINAGLAGMSWSSLAWGDYDNDGDLDLAIFGSYSTKIYKNNGDNTFTDIQAGLTAMSQGSITWGDYDNDGDLDLAICGWDGVEYWKYTTKIYRNNGDDTFTDVQAGLPGIGLGTLAWGDYDNDGYLDLAISGATPGNIARIYRNNGDNTFTNINAGLPGVVGSLAWGDYNNDGYLDLVLNGSVYKNNGDNTFTDIRMGVPEIYGGSTDNSVAWGDYDNDGDLDLAIFGRVVLEDDDVIRVTKIYMNLEADSEEGGNHPNVPPSPPVNLTYEQRENGVILKWDSGSDTEASDAGLYYNIRVGTSPGSGDIVSGVYGSPLLGKYLRPKVSSDQLGLRVQNLLLGTYYWSVQTIDTALAASPWSAEETFVIRPSYTVSGEVTLEGGDSAVTDVLISLTEDEIILSLEDEIETIYPVADGSYLFTGLLEGETYTMTLSLAEYHFFPTSRSYSSLESDQTNQNFTGLHETYDSDSDTLPDWWELENFGSLEQGGKDDPDEDDWDNSEEREHVTDPNDPNSFPGLFVDSGIELPGVYGGTVVWGDYDNDDDLDLAVCNFSGSVGIYENDNDTFTDIEAELTGGWGNLIAWGDYDNDGDLDLAVCSASTTKIYRNADNNTFADIGIGLAGIGESGYGSIVWGDYDNDGDLDLAVGGLIYRNNGDNTFTDIEVGVPSVELGSFAWGDYNNDGYLDLAVCGYNYSEGGLITRVYKNNGEGTFADIGAELIGVDLSSLAWGDYDNDGDLDLAVCGEAWDSGEGAITRIYKNNGDDTFTIAVELTGVAYSSLSWGDYDNDGDLDLAVCGYDFEEGTTKIYENRGDDTFTDVGTSLPGIKFGSLAWGDYDNDGKLDLAICGDNEDGNSITKIYKNNTDTINAVPIAPENLTSEKEGNGVILKWDSGVDEETVDTGLYYNLRVGTCSMYGLWIPGTHDVVSGVYGSPLLGNYLRPKLSLDQLGIILKGLPAGDYYWSVQTIDTGLKASAWSEEETFVVSSYPSCWNSPTQSYGDANDDGWVNTEDWTILREAWATDYWTHWNEGAGPYDPRADFNRDGYVGLGDFFIMKDNFNHEVPADGPLGGIWPPEQNSSPSSWDSPTQSYGDTNGDGWVNTADWPIFRDAWATDYWTHWNDGAGPYDPAADFNRDGSVDTGDWPIFRDNFGQQVSPDGPIGGIWPPVE